MLDLSTVATLPHIDEVTLSETANVLTSIVFPSDIGRRKFSVYAYGTDAYFTMVGTDGETVGDAKKAPLPADQWVELPRLQSGIFFGSASQSQVLAVMLEEWR